MEAKEGNCFLSSLVCDPTKIKCGLYRAVRSDGVKAVKASFSKYNVSYNQIPSEINISCSCANLHDPIFDEKCFSLTNDLENLHPLAEKGLESRKYKQRFLYYIDLHQVERNHSKYDGLLNISANSGSHRSSAAIKIMEEVIDLIINFIQQTGQYTNKLTYIHTHAFSRGN